MSLYRYLVLLERQKKVTKYDVSYSDITRQNSGDTDGFLVKISNGHKFKIMNDSGKTPTCKTWFGDSLSLVEASDVIQKVFRFRFDRVKCLFKTTKTIRHAQAECVFASWSPSEGRFAQKIDLMGIGLVPNASKYNHLCLLIIMG